MPAYRFVVQGTVQGVGFRYFVLRRAEALGLAGYVRNLPDGAVEVFAEGAAQALEELEHQLRQGPSSSEVTSVEREPSRAGGARGFHIR